MIYLSLAAVLPALWFGPWWSLIPVGLVFGFWLRGEGVAKFALGCGLAWAALAFIRDGESAGMVSYRMAGIFALPDGGWLFAVIALLGFVTGFLWFRAGAELRVLLKK